MAESTYSSPSYDRVVRLDPTAAPAPRYAMITWYDVFNDGVWKVGPPAYDEDLDVFTTYDAPMAPGDETPATDDRSRIATYAIEDGIPQVGDEWGTKAGDYRLRKGYRGFRVTSQGYSDGTVNVVRLFAINPRKSSGSGSGIPPDQLGGVVDLQMVQTIAGAGCALTYTGQIVRLQMVNNQLTGRVISTFAGTVNLGPFSVTGSGTFSVPSQSGTISGTVGTCTLSGTVTVPASPPITVPITGTATCP